MSEPKSPPAGDGTPTDDNDQAYPEGNGWEGQVWGVPTPRSPKQAYNQGGPALETTWYDQRDDMVGGTDSTWQRDSGVGPDVSFNPNWGSAGDTAPIVDAQDVDRFGATLSFDDLGNLVN